MIVIDASLALDLVLVTPAAFSISARIGEAGGEIAAPELIDCEVLQALRRQLSLKQIDRRRAEEAFELYQGMPLERYPHRLVLARGWALRDNLTAYDAVYLALAELLDAPLWTRDEKLATAPAGKGRVEVF
ncbi:MAG: type II toxin-antitoxin system VapC family toxin [Parvularculaceae bacterium]|nr:type II toxin-antitoxin system VapC family toxin [Parvularculaceae bacterium]